MTKNIDDTATCDRCGLLLTGYGVLQGLVVTRLSDDESSFLEEIYCYGSACRDILLENAVQFTRFHSGDPGCTFCGIIFEYWSPIYALIGRDIDENDNDRPLAFCRVNGHDQMILSRAVIGEV